MDRVLLPLILLCFFCSILMPSFPVTAAIPDDEEQANEKIDDWLFSQKEIENERATGGMQLYGAPVGSAIPRVAAMAAAPHMKKKLGFAVGGAKDTNNFRQNILDNFLPKYHAMTYEGLFYDYYFDTGAGSGECRELFCPSYSKAVVPDLFSGELNYYLSVGLNSGLAAGSFARKKLNLVVVVDISGSMGGSFSSYYYDRSGKPPEEKTENAKTKMQLANETIVAMMQHLQDDDRLGVVLFDDQAHLAKPLRLVKQTDMKAIAGHIRDIREQGGTNWQAGYEEGLKLYSSLENNRKDPQHYENRIIFLTDAMPNLGELEKGGLLDMTRKAADKGIYTSFIGVGVDFNPELVEYVTKTRGANYFSVHSASEFKKTLADEFDFMVTPLVFDLELTVKSDNYTIDGVFGSPEADLATGSVMKIKTLFPSATEEKQVKGGVVLIKLKSNNTAEISTPIELSVRYRDRDGQSFTVTDTVSFVAGKKGYDNNGIRKAILLAEYASLIKNWLLDQNKGCNDQVEIPIIAVAKYGLINPESRQEREMISIWEKKSCPFAVSSGYQKLFTLFRKRFQQEAAVIGDQHLEKELKILDKLTDKKEQTEADHATGPIDDWQPQKKRHETTTSK